MRDALRLAVQQETSVSCPHYHDERPTTTMEYRIATPHHNISVQADSCYLGGDDCFHFKRGNDTETVATVPREKLEAWHRGGDV